jgi:hypothetical protein
MGGERRVTSREEKRASHRVLVKKPWERNSLELTSVNEKIMFK